MRTVRPVLLLLAVLAALPATAPARGVPRCTPVPLAVGAAARVPALNGSTVGTVGNRQARAIATQLRSGADLCKAQPGTAARRAVAAIGRAGSRAAAHRLVTRALRRLPRPHATHRRAFASASGCGVDTAPHIKGSDAPGVKDALAIAKAAFAAGDDAGGQAAVDQAAAAYDHWGNDALDSAQTVGDALTVAAGADMFGNESLSAKATAKARQLAQRDMDKAGVGKADPCTANQDQLKCQVRAVAVAQMLGLEVDVAQAVRPTLDAIGDRLDHKPVDGCETWSFEMTWTSGGFEIRWAKALFRVSRKEGRIDGVRKAAMSVPTVPLPCGTLQGGLFLYGVTGSVADDQWEVDVAAPDAHVDVSGLNGEDIPCLTLLGFAQPTMEGLVKGPLPVPFTVAQDATSSDFSETEEDGTVIAGHIEQVNAG